MEMTLQRIIHRRTINMGHKRLELGERTLIMGIVNVTPDSFSDGGRFDTVDKAVGHARQLMEEGADILDIGGESTRPGAAFVSADEECSRVIPVLERLREIADVPVSIDTYKSDVAREALRAGADILNDVWGFRRDPQMATVAANAGCPVILMHNREQRDYTDFLADVQNDLLQCVQLAAAAGVDEERIILDPGIGFAKDLQENLFLMNHLHELVALGYPVLLGTSRKSMIRSILQLPADDVIEGTAATVTAGIMQGCQIMRVHDVKQMKRVAAMTDAMVNSTWRRKG